MEKEINENEYEKVINDYEENLIKAFHGVDYIDLDCLSNAISLLEKINNYENIKN